MPRPLCRRQPAVPQAVRLLAFAVLTASATVPAQAIAAQDPAQRQAEAPQPVYRSAFGLYRPWQEQALGDWRALNDRVGRIGGWRTYLREAHAPEPASPATMTAPPMEPGATPAAPVRPRPGHDHGQGHSPSHSPPAGEDAPAPAPATAPAPGHRVDRPLTPQGVSTR